MKRIATFALIALTTLFATSCRKATLRGQGNIESETRNLSSFTTIVASGSTDVEVFPSSENKVIVTGYANLLPIFRTEVLGNTLYLDFEPEYWNVMNNNIKITLYTTDMDAVRLSGSGKVHIHKELAANTMEIDISGSGDVTVDHNEFDTFHCKVSGSGTINARHAACDEVYAEISGSGDLDITVNELLEAKI
ncbi:MAG TPA: DUF2807 domain-containing protein, partial [Flavipsychrobacter sp.]|nr:DUF2807 domain-containing protein [Flavipsychrobacter sp.]